MKAKKIIYGINHIPNIIRFSAKKVNCVEFATHEKLEPNFISYNKFFTKGKLKKSKPGVNLSNELLK